MQIKGLVFDFDGLILDTETPRFQAWVKIYKQFNLEFTEQMYARSLGTTIDIFNPIEHLEAQVVDGFDKPAIAAMQQKLENELLEKENPLPGVIDYLQDACTLGLKIGIASSSDRPWVVNHLIHLGIERFFHAVVTHDDISPAKPHPALYSACLTRLGVPNNEAVAFEDSPHGITSAKAAGLICIAVPNPISKYLDLSSADKIVSSLSTYPLNSLIHDFQNPLLDN